MPLGPVEMIVVQFPGTEVKGDIVPAIKELVEQGTIRVIAILFLKRDEQGEAQLETMQAQQLLADEAQAATAVPTAKPGFITQLQQLAQLKQVGALTEEEFQAAKAKLLSS